MEQGSHFSKTDSQGFIPQSVYRLFLGSSCWSLLKSLPDLSTHIICLIFQSLFPQIQTAGINLVGTALKVQEAKKRKNNNNQYVISGISAMDFHFCLLRYDSKMYVVVKEHWARFYCRIKSP